MNVLVIAPHPDDETLGCGGVLLKHKNNNEHIYWLTITSAIDEKKWGKEFIKKRKLELESVKNEYGFKKSFHLEFPPAYLDTVPISDIVDKISKIIKEVKPELIYVPYSSDVHTDHQIISKSLGSIIKWFRHPSVNKVLMYETLSETDFNFLSANSFKPNYFVDISDFIKKKIEIMKIYSSEMNLAPFPRSEKVLIAQSVLRGSQCGFDNAEAFNMIYMKIK